MTKKKYRICIAVCFLVIVACSVFVLYEKNKEKQEFEDGILVERQVNQDCEDSIFAECQDNRDREDEIVLECRERQKEHKVWVKHYFESGKEEVAV